MDEQIKENRLRWIEELESGNWSPARDVWRNPEEGTHCCLDVANCLFAGELTYNGTEQSIYREIYYRVTSHKLGINQTEFKGSTAWFIEMNDKKRKSFAEIAAACRELWDLPKEA